MNGDNHTKIDSIVFTVANNIKKFRKQMMLSQEELSFRAGLHRTFIGSVERGEKVISILNLNKIAKALKINIAELVD
jgi:transcriptional regulator with XRE-family HTH domain